MGVHRSEYRVLFGDTDGMGIVYNANYLRIFEMARTEWFRELLRSPSEMVERDMYLIVVQAFVHYHSPATYDQILDIDCWIPAEKVKKASFHFDYHVMLRETKKKVATGYTVHALTNRKGKLKRMPEDFQMEVMQLAVKSPPARSKSKYP